MVNGTQVGVARVADAERRLWHQGRRSGIGPLSKVEYDLLDDVQTLADEPVTSDEFQAAFAHLRRVVAGVNPMDLAIAYIEWRGMDRLADECEPRREPGSPATSGPVAQGAQERADALLARLREGVA